MNFAKAKGQYGDQCYVVYGPPYRLLSNQWTYGLGLYFFYLGPLGPRYLGPNGPR